VLDDAIAAGSLDEVRVFFPTRGPSPGTPSVASSRVVRALVADRLRPGGRLHVATDWRPTPRRSSRSSAASRDLQLRSTDRGGRPSTRFERRGVAAGRPITDVVALRR
jgi:tRNA (guanine-N7-)-methyltransferase